MPWYEVIALFTAALCSVAAAVFSVCLLLRRRIDDDVIRLRQDVQGLPERMKLWPSGSQFSASQDLASELRSSLERLEGMIRGVESLQRPSTALPSLAVSVGSKDPQSKAMPQVVPAQQVLDLYRAGADSLRQRFQVVCAARAAGIAPVFEEHDAGSFWVFKVEDAWYSVPNPSIKITPTLYHDGGLKSLFDCIGYVEGRRYGTFTLKAPAQLQHTGGGWAAWKKGALEVGVEEA